jgi:NodT family efflux transporter outer membrane factor (OMF) lipoprotein
VKRGAVAFVLLAAACATPQPRSEAVQRLPAGFHAAASDGLPAAEWWRRRLSDPALARLVEAALLNSPDLAAAAARIEQARAGLKASESERMPLLNGSAGVTYNRSSANEFGFEAPAGGPGGPQIDRERVLYRAGVEGSWDADLFGRLRSNERAARARLDAAGFDASAVRLALVTDVARNLVAARSALARERIARETIDSARLSLDLAAKRARAGLVAGIDRTRAETLLAETGAALAPVQAERSARLAALAALTALAPAEIEPLIARSPQTPRFETPAVGVPSDLLLRRPDISAALTRVAAADAATASAIAARYPRLTITGAIGLVAAALGDIFSLDALTASAGPGLAGSILDFGRNRARADLARAQAREAVAAWRGTVLRAFAEVETSLAAVDGRERQRLALLRQLEAAAETVAIARKQYSSGLTDYLGVLDSERAVNRARDQLAAAEAEAADAQLALFRAIGGDFERAPGHQAQQAVDFQTSSP